MTAPRSVSLPRFSALLLLGLLALPAAPVLAAGGGGGDTAPAAPQDPDFKAGRAAIDKKDWAAAVPLFEKVVARDEKNADAYNWLGYALRNQGDYEKAFIAYGRALGADPRHRGAREYLGEAYLKTGNLAMAEEQLKKLDSLCTFGCAEYTELKNKIAAFKAGKSG
ncbi:tetratricopeptide repeat protein [Ferrovibrio sp.]|uniref:tetratricopeptide repeat protein n=1 Tax=Ferrovibrio sp. TaxID=1917215 RepID=UPI0035114DCA